MTSPLQWSVYVRTARLDWLPYWAGSSTVAKAVRICGEAARSQSAWNGEAALYRRHDGSYLHSFAKRGKVRRFRA